MKLCDNLTASFFNHDRRRLNLEPSDRNGTKWNGKHIKLHETVRQIAYNLIFCTFLIIIVILIDCFVSGSWFLGTGFWVFAISISIAISISTASRQKRMTQRSSLQDVESNVFMGSGGLGSVPSVSELLPLLSKNFELETRNFELTPRLWRSPLSPITFHLSPSKVTSSFCRAAARGGLVFFSTVRVWVYLKRVFCLGAFGLASLASAADTQWSISVPALMRDELVAVTLPTALFANGQTDATTLRVRDEQGGEIPVRYEPLQTVVHVRRRIPTAPFTMTAAEMPDGALRLTLRRPVPPASVPVPSIEGLTIQTPLRDFEQRVGVEVSKDGVNWTNFVEQAPLFDFSRHADVRRTEIAFPSGLTDLHLRLTFEQAVDVREQLTAFITATQSEARGATESRAVHVDTRPFHVESVSGWTSSRIEASRKPVLADYPITWTPLTNGVPRGKTRYAIEAQGQPLTRLIVTIPSDYASWPYTLTSDLSTGRPLAQGVLKQFCFRGITDAATAIVFPEIRAQRYVLTFDHPRANVTDITARGPRYRFVFPARPLHRYTLLQLLEPESRLPDASQIVALLARDVQPIEGMLETTAQPVAARRPGYAWLRRHFFHIGIGVALLVLAFSLSRAMRRL